MDRRKDAIQVGTFNIDGSKSAFAKDEARSCKKLSGKLTKARILSVSPEKMVFEAYYKKIGQLNW
jgi:hypothetical protein